MDLLNHGQRDGETELELWEEHWLLSYQQPAHGWKDHISQPPQNLAFKRKRSSAHTFLSEIGPEKTPSLLRHFSRQSSQGLSGHQDTEERLLIASISSCNSVNHSICSWHFESIFLSTSENESLDYRLRLYPAFPNFLQMKVVMGGGLHSLETNVFCQ